MAYTIFDADLDGKFAALDSNFSGHIPAHFDRDKRLRDAWIEGYNGMASSVDKRCWSPPAPPVRKPRAPKAEVTGQPEPPKVKVTKMEAPLNEKPIYDSMEAALEAQLQLAK